MVWRRFGTAGGGSGGPSRVTEDHIFQSAQARDDYFTANVSRLAELITGTPIIVVISGAPRFQTWGAITPTQLSAYSNTNWATQSAINGAEILSLLNAMSGISVQTTDQSETVNSLSNLSTGRFPIATARGLVDSDLRIINQELFVPGRAYIEATGLDLGEVTRLSESAGSVSYTSILDRIRHTLIDFRSPANAASSRPRRLALTQAERQFDIQANVSDPMTANELGGTYTINQLGRINALQFFSQTAVFNVRIAITSGFDVVKYIPSREAWDNGTGGLDFTPGGELLIRIDDSPLFSAANQIFSITIRKGSGTLLGFGGLPAFVIRIQNGTYTELADLNDVPDNIGDLDDIPNARGTTGQTLAVNADASGLQYITPTLLALSDTPAAFGAAGLVLAVNTARNALEFVAQVAANSFAGLTDTPTTLTAGQYFRVNTAGNALEQVRDPSRWDHRVAPITGTLSADHHVWYRNTNVTSFSVDLPTLTAADEGWDMVWQNDTAQGQTFLDGNFGGTVSSHLVASNERVLISFNGTIFTVGPR